ncbi:hypothetical protein LTR82_005856 [Friedmanniomyces endolithicus]|uniref:Uncharacterized protein n=1 Tax=Friedmanniomyces endolithicus TaxID=329885 RepID=A0AAN6FRL9_9PEZI|nr:hypothetical protein LTR82_005856 [Friedmanniomyces endolithicus]
MGHFAWSVGWSNVSLHIGYIIDPRYWQPGRISYGPWLQSARQGSGLAVQSARDTVQNKMLFILPSPWPEMFPGWEEVLTLDPQTGKWEDSRIKSVLIHLYGASVAAGVGDWRKMSEFEEMAEGVNEVARRLWIEERVRRLKELEGEMEAVKRLPGNIDENIRKVKAREGPGEVSGSELVEHDREREIVLTEKTKKPKKKTKGVVPPDRLPESTVRSSTDAPCRPTDLGAVDMDLSDPTDKSKPRWNAANPPSPVQTPKRVHWKPAADLASISCGGKCANTGTQPHAASPATQDRQAGALLLEAMKTPDTSGKRRGKLPAPDVAERLTATKRLIRTPAEPPTLDGLAAAEERLVRPDNDNEDRLETEKANTDPSLSQTQLNRVARKEKKARHQENKRRARLETASQETSARRLRAWERMGVGAAVCCLSEGAGSVDVPLSILNGVRHVEEADPDATREEAKHARPVQQPTLHAAQNSSPPEEASVDILENSTKPLSGAKPVRQSCIGTISPAHRPMQIASEDDGETASVEDRPKTSRKAVVQQDAKRAQDREVHATILSNPSPASAPSSQAATDMVGVTQAEQRAPHRSKKAEFARSMWQSCNVCAPWSCDVFTCPHADRLEVGAIPIELMETSCSPCVKVPESEPNREPQRAHRGEPLGAIEHHDLSEESRRVLDVLIAEQAAGGIEPARHEHSQTPNNLEPASHDLELFDQTLFQTRRATVPPSGRPPPEWALDVAEETPNNTEQAQHGHAPVKATLNEPRRATVPPSDPPPPEWALTGADYAAHIEQDQDQAVLSDRLTREMNAHFPYWVGSFPRGWTPCQICGWLSEHPKLCTHEGRQLWEEEYRTKPARDQLWWPKVPDDEDTVAPEHPAWNKSSTREQLEPFPIFDGWAYPTFPMQRWDYRSMGLLPPVTNFQPNFQTWRYPHAHFREQPAASRPHHALTERKRAARVVESAIAIARGAHVVFTSVPPPRKYEGTIWMVEPITGRLGLQLKDDDAAADSGVSLSGFKMSEIHTLAFRTVGARCMTSNTWSVPLATLPGAVERMADWLRWLCHVSAKGLTPITLPPSRPPTPLPVVLQEATGSNSDSSRTPSPHTVRSDSVFFDKIQRLMVNGDSCKSIDGDPCRLIDEAFNPIKRMLNEIAPLADREACAANGGILPPSHMPLAWPSEEVEDTPTS